MWPQTKFHTHEVTNQSSDYAGFNAFRGDPLLRLLAADFPDAVLTTTGAAWALLRLASRLMIWRGSPISRRRACVASTRRAGGWTLVDYHPAYHALMRRSVADGLHASIWQGPEEEAGRRHAVRAARFYMTAGVECGHLCPVTMTSASVAALAAAPKLRDAWLPVHRHAAVRPQRQAAADQKAGITLGMGMTEKQGGTDVRANTTRAVDAGGGHLPHDRAQMVHVGADVRRVPRPGADAGGADLLPDAPRAATTAR